MSMYCATKHAAEVIATRKIEDDWIRLALQLPAKTHPDESVPTLEHRLAPIPAYDFRILRVIYKKGTIPPLVVTAYFDRTMKGKL